VKVGELQNSCHVEWSNGAPRRDRWAVTVYVTDYRNWSVIVYATAMGGVQRGSHRFSNTGGSASENIPAKKNPAPFRPARVITLVRFASLQ
jgi:hypothetical protein